jgi:hypothetical protein
VLEQGSAETNARAVPLGLTVVRPPTCSPRAVVERNRMSFPSAVTTPGRRTGYGGVVAGEVAQFAAISVHGVDVATAGGGRVRLQDQSATVWRPRGVARVEGERGHLSLVTSVETDRDPGGLFAASAVVAVPREDEAPSIG